MNGRPAPVDLFERQWQAYRSVIDNDWMEHRGITTACAEALSDWMSAHPDRAGSAELLDLGCGDLARMGPVFAALPLGGYTGVDLTEQVLPMAHAALGTVPFRTSFQHGDIGAFVRAKGDSVDLVHAALVLHHLSDPDKVEFLAALRPRVRPGGVFVWADVFRDRGETRESFTTRYAARVRRDWRGIDDDAREAIVTHMSTFDFPADRERIAGVARELGWDWRWVWQGKHRAEAVAVLTNAGRD